MFKHLFSFKGRMSRGEYWVSAIVTPIVTVIFFLLLTNLAFDPEGLLTTLWMVAFFVAAIWYELAENTRRCHDLGRSGWWQLIPFYGVWMLFAAGQKGPNQYGPDPKSEEEYQDPMDMKRTKSEFDLELEAIRVDREQQARG